MRQARFEERILSIELLSDLAVKTKTTEGVVGTHGGRRSPVAGDFNQVGWALILAG